MTDFIEETICDTLDDANVKAYPLRKPKGAALPVVVYQRVSETDMRSHDRVLDIKKARIQLTAWADNYSGAKTTAESVKGALNGNTTDFSACLLVNQNETIETDGTVGIIMDFFVWSKGA